MAKKKMRKFADGGFTAEQNEWLGGADRTDPYILARMRSAVPDSTDTYKDNKPYSSDDQGLALTKEMVAAERAKNGYVDAPVTKTVTQSKVAVTKPKSTWEDDSKIPAMPDVPRKPETAAENKARMESLVKKQALIDVSPEDYVAPGGILKGMLKSIAGKGLKTYTAKELADMAPKMIGRESLKLGREPLKIGMKKGGSVKKMSSGGKVKSASSRADGCAIRGKTRA
jgi:hypothetical protein